jgi:mono/diheme cytochrome c family protein
MFLRRSAHGVSIVIVFSVLAPAQTPPASYDEGLKPVLARNCSGCHTSGGHAGGLRMDSSELILKGGEKGPVIVPGDPQNSLLVKAIHYDDADLKMPPRGKISNADIAAIEGWIQNASLATISSATPKPAVETPVKAEAPAPVPASGPSPAVDAQITPEQEQFFETQIRPLLTKNCYACHTNLSSGGLRLDSRDAMLKGGKDGVVVVPGHPESSLLVSALHYDAKLQMPPSGQLKPAEVAVVERWIQDGAKWPASSPVIATPKVTDAQRNFWSFRAPARPAVPATTSSWVHNDIDRFILAKLDEQHLKPVADADKRMLIRRVTYDLTGLPPTPAEVQSFLDDKSKDAYENLVDRLLASKAYGERWGRMWLDVVRYADTSGGGGDYPVPQAAKYRDYVIQAFNDDKPYDRFIREQIAGDLLPAASEAEHWQNLIATGYLAGTNRADGKQIFVADAVDNLGSAYLGVTVGCARCHDHKFDPIPTADYYAIYGILSSTHYPESGTDEVRFQRGFVYRDPEALNREDSKIFEAQLKPVQNAIEAVLKLPGTYDDLLPQLQARRMHLFEHVPDLGESAYAVTEGEPEDAKIQHYGDPRDLGEKVPRGFLQVLGGSSLPADTKGSGRLELANWIASKDNPLTARVIVNRIWQGHFGRGIVPTANDFGTRGVAPSNQALLDHLAVKLVDNGWSLKSLHKEILLSHAYMLSSADSAANEEIDPDNAYIWRHSRSRLDAEEIRDSLLAVSQLLDRSPAGTHPFPPQAEWNWEDQNHFSPEASKYETDRRTVYMMIQRTVRLPYFTLFDGPNTNVSTEQRSSSLTPLQALYFMNADFPRRAAKNLASVLLAGGAPDKQNVDKQVVQQAFLTVYGRPPAPAESDRATAFLHRAADAYATHGMKDAVQPVALEELLKALFASNEFMFVE